MDEVAASWGEDGPLRSSSVELLLSPSHCGRCHDVVVTASATGNADTRRVDTRSTAALVGFPLASIHKMSA